MKLTNPFGVNETIHSYWYPLIKIVICLFFLTITFFINRIIVTDSNLLRIIMTIIAFIILICSILAIYVSIGEMIIIHDKNSNTKEQMQHCEYKTVDASIDQVLDLLRNNDCMDIKVLIDSRIVHIGSASDNNVKDNIFFNKAYYIYDNWYETVEPFAKALTRLSIFDNNLKIIEIDGLSPLKYSAFSVDKE